MPGIKNVPSISIPPLQITIFSVESMPMPVHLMQEAITSMRPNLSNFTKQMLNMNNTASMPNVYGVPLLSEQILCVSCLHPNASTESCLSQQVGSATVLPQQNCTLNKMKTNLLFLAPSMKIKVMFRSESPALTQSANAETTAACASTEKSTDQTTHLFTASIPLEYVLQQLMKSETIEHNIMTSEDDNKLWKVELKPVKTNNISAQAFQQQYSMQMDAVKAHVAWVKSEMGYCETLLETATFVTQARLERKKKCTAVLKQLVPDELPTTWDLQMSRPLGVAMTPSGVEPIKLDQQALEHLRVGSASGDQAQQTFLMFVNSLASATVQIAQQADVHIGFDPSTQLAVFDPVAFQNANAHFVAQYGADALMKIVQLKCQENVFSSTKYTSDPHYDTVMQMQAANINMAGTGQINFQSKIELSKNTAGEDQQIGVGYGLEDKAGVLNTDCEDDATFIIALSSQMLAFSKAEFLQSTTHALSYFPRSVQQITNTIVSMAEVLHKQENENMQHANNPQTNKVLLENLNMNVLRNAISQAKDAPAVRIVSACSLLAKAPSIGDNTSTTVSIRDKTLASSQITPARMFEWWGTSRENGLNGHSVCTAINAHHVLTTHVEGKPVVVTLVDKEQDIFEGTGVARETSTPASQVATLNFATDRSSLTPQRVLLQQKLDSGIVLNTALASNIKSALNAAEVTKVMANTAVKAKTTGAPIGVSMQQKAMQVPIVTAIQAYTLSAGESATAAQRELTIQTMFYAVGLSCGIGPLYSIPMSNVVRTGDPLQYPYYDKHSDVWFRQELEKFTPSWNYDFANFDHMANSEFETRIFVDRCKALQQRNNDDTLTVNNVNEFKTQLDFFFSFNKRGTRRQYGNPDRDLHEKDLWKLAKAAVALYEHFRDKFPVDDTQANSQAITSMQIVPGIPFTRDLIPESTFARVVVSAPCCTAEAQRLRTMGAYLALGKLPADLYMTRSQASFMPLHLRQSMILCPLNNCLTPLSAAQMQNTTSFKCGVVTKSPYLVPKTGAKYETTAEIEANMHAIYTNLCNVIRCLPVVTGTGFSDTMMIVYP